MDGNYQLVVRVHKPRNEIEDFQISASIAATGGLMLLGELGNKEITRCTNKDSGEHMSAYMQTAMHQLLERAKQVKTIDKFGWQDDKRGFLLGKTMYNTDGTESPVLLSGFACRSWLGRRGQRNLCPQGYGANAVHPVECVWFDPDAIL
jgi:hypothetical protein